MGWEQERKNAYRSNENAGLKTNPPRKVTRASSDTVTGRIATNLSCLATWLISQAPVALSLFNFKTRPYLCCTFQMTPQDADPSTEKGTAFVLFCLVLLGSGGAGL